MRPPLRTIAAALALAPAVALAATPGPAPSAGPALRVAVATLDAPPQLAFTARSVADGFARRAAAAGYEVLGPAAVAERIGRAAAAALAGCGDDAACLADRGGALGVDRIVGGTLARRGASYRVALVSSDPRTGARLAGVEREIAVASRRLRRDVAEAAPGLLRGEDDPTGVLRVVTEVPGAEVWVDDLAVGRTPVARFVKPGKHKVKVARAGYADAEPAWVEVPARGVVEHLPRLYAIPPRERAAPPAAGGAGGR